MYEVSIPAFQDDKDPRAATLQWVAGNSAFSRGVAPVAAVKKQQFVEKLRTMPEKSLPTSVGWMDVQMRAAETAESLGEEDDDAKVIVGTSIRRERWLVCSSLAGVRPGVGVVRHGREQGFGPVGRHRREGAAPRRRRVLHRSLRRPSLLLPSPAGANRAARPRQRLLRAVVQPEGHLVRRRHGGRRRGEERVEPGSARRRVRTRVRKNIGGGGGAAGPHERVLRPLSHRAVAQRSVVADPPAALFEPFADSLPEGDGSV